MKRLIMAGMVMLATGAGAQSHRWESLAEVKPGATLIVETANRYGPMGYDRCRMVSADTASLTCTEEGRQGARLVFPAEQVEYVSRVTKPFHLWPYLALAVAGIFAGGVASGNVTAIKLGLAGGLVAVVAAGVESQRREFDAVIGRPQAPDERVRLIYRKPPVPPSAPVPASPEGR